MRTSFIIFGVIFLVLGLFLYLVPMQQIRANTFTSDGTNVDTRTSYASLTIPVGWSYASMSIGFVLLVFGLAIPNRNRNGGGDSKRNSYDKMVRSEENTGDGNKKKIVTERTEQHKSRRDDN